MGKQYIPGVSGLLTEQNPVDAPSNTLSDAENIVVEQGGKVQARHGFNINHKKNTIDFTDAADYIYTSQYNNILPFIKLLEYKDSADTTKTLLFVKQTRYPYEFASSGYGIYKTGITSTRNRYYIVDSNGEFTGFRSILQYNNILNAFNTKESLYLQTENGLAETNVDVLDNPYTYLSEVDNPTFFDIKWPFFPEISYKLIDSQLFGNWLRGGTKCNVRMTFFREMGYTDKPNDNIYESEPSVPLLVTSFNKDCIPSIFFDFKTEKDGLDIYLKLNEFTRLNGGRKFGIRLYRTKIVDLNEDIPDEYFQCYPDILFENFFSGQFNIFNNTQFPNETSYREASGSLIDSTNRINYLENEIENNIVRFNTTIAGITDGVDYYITNRLITASGNTDSLASFQIVDTFNNIIDITSDVSNIGIKFFKSKYYYEIVGDASYPITLNVGDIVSAIYSPLSIGQELPFISGPNIDYAFAPYRFKTTSNELKQQDYYPTRFEVVDKYKSSGSYLYSFKTIDYIFLFSKKLQINSVSNTTSATDNRIALTITAPTATMYNFPKNGNIALRIGPGGYLGPLKSDKTYSYQIKTLSVSGSNTTVIMFLNGTSRTNEVTYGINYIIPIIEPQSSIDISKLNGFDGIIRSYNTDLNISDSGLDGQPRLYTDANIDSASNTNTIVPVSTNSIKYKDFWIYSGIQKPLEAYLYVTKQPSVAQLKLNIDTTSIINSNTISIQNFRTNNFENLSTDIGSSADPRYFIDCPVFLNRDVQISDLTTEINNSSTNYNITTYAESEVRITTDAITPVTWTSIAQQTVTVSTVTFDHTTENITITVPSGTYDISIISSIIKFTSGTLPSGFLLNTDYYTRNVTKLSSTSYRFQLSSTPTGGIISFTTNGTGPFNSTVRTVDQYLLVSFTAYTSDTFIDNTIVSFVDGTGVLPSNIIVDRRYYIKYVTGSSPKTYYLSDIYNGSYLTYVDAGGATNYASIDSKISNLFFNATAYEQTSLTLKLTSSSDEVNTITVYLRPFYNRRGYYTKYLQNGTLDNRALEFDLSLKESNGISTTFTSYLNKNFALLGDASKIYNIPGKSNNQAMYNGQIKGSDAIVSASTITFDSATDKVTITTPSAITGTILDSTIRFTAGTMPTGISANTDYYVRNVVVNSTTSFTFQVSTTPTGTILDFTSNGSGITYSLNASNVIYAQNGQDSGVLIIRNSNANSTDQDANAFDIKSFPQPGFMFVQLETSSGVWSTALFSYSSNEPGYHLNSYRFNNVKLVAGASANILSTTTYLNSKKYFYAIKAATIEEIALYPYSDPPNLSSINYLVGGTLTVEYDSTSPHFTVVPHKLKTTIPIATLAKDGNIQFYGADAGYAKSSTELLEDYTYSIVEQFNKELRLAEIKAFLFKGENAGEIGIVYPDGKKVEIKNNYGNHMFFPNINNRDDNLLGAEYFLLAERINNEYIEKNMIQWSRRNIPEITTGLLYKYLGKNDKQIIGMAANTDDLYIFKEDGIWRCTDSGSLNDFDLPVVSDYLFSNNFVCQSAGSIQEINDEIIFLSQYGFASIANGGIQIIDGSINRDIVNLVSVSPKDRIRSFVNESKNLYYCTLINETEPTLSVKSGTYVFNTRTRQWSFMDEEILTGIEDSQNKSVVAFRQRPVKAKRTATKTVSGRQIPVFDFTDSSVIDANGHIARAQETTPLDMFYIAREQYTNNVKRNAADQYDFKYNALISDATTYLYKSGTNSFWFITESVPNVASDKIRDKFKSSAHIALLSSIGDTNVNAPLIDSYITLFANRTLFLQKVNSLDMYEIRLKKTDVQTSTNNLQVFFEFIGDTPSWFDALSDGNSLGGISDFRILAGIPVKITFNPESGSAPDTNKLFQEYMIHTETANKGAVMSFKTDSRSNLTSDRRFVYDAATTNRNVFRTYIPMNASRGRYLIRQIKHDLPLENLIITGQTVVMRDSGSTRVQKDKDNE